MGVIKELVQRADSWVNAMTGLGTLRDKLMHTQVVAGTKISDPVLEALFNDDDVARRVVAKLPREATRRGFEIVLEGDPDEEGTADTARQMLDNFAKLDGMPKLRDGWIWARLYGGGSGVFVGADDGLPVDQPLNEAGIRSIKFLNIVKRPQLSVQRRYEDLQAPEYGKPETYLISQATGTSLVPREGLEVHETRLVLFDGALTARMTMESPSGFDDSVLQNAMAPLQQTAAAWQSVAHLLTDASQGVLKIANLVDLVAAGGQEVLRTRIQLMDLARSVCRAILVDAEKESFERVTTSFAGLPEVMDKLMMRMCAAAEQPATLLYGRSPAGMNATGESDIRGWYDTVAESQTDELKPRLMRLLTLMFLAKDSPTRGKLPEQWCIEFNPLWQPTDKEDADTKKVIADTYVALVTGNIMTDAEAGQGLATVFPTIDLDARDALAEADAEEGLRPREVNTPPPEPDPNADPEGGGGGGGGAPRGDSGQPREPAGSSKGGQWTAAGGGAGGAAKKVSAKKDVFTAEQRANLKQSFKSGKNPVVVALQQKLVAKYGVPLAKAALLYEKDIKAKLKAAKGGPVKAPTATGTTPTAVPSAKAVAKAAHLHVFGEPNPKLVAKAAAKLAKAKAKTEAAAAKLAATKAKTAAHIAEVAALKHGTEQGFHNIPLSSLKTISKYGDPHDPKAKPAALAMLKAKEAAAKPTATTTATSSKAHLAALKKAEKLGYNDLGHTQLRDIAQHGATKQIKAAAAAMLKAKTAPDAPTKPKKSFTEKWGIGKPKLSKYEQKLKDDFEAEEKEQTSRETKAIAKLPPKPKGAGVEHVPFPTTSAPTLAGHLIKGGSAGHTSKHTTPYGIKASEQAPLKVAPSPHQAAMEKAVKEHGTSFKVVEQAVGKAHAEEGYTWKAKWVSTSTDGLAESAIAGLQNPKSHINAQYHATQTLLKHHMPELQARGIVDKDGYVRLYRGVKTKQGDKIRATMDKSPDGTATMDVRGTSSWTASHSVARSFAGGAGAVVQQRVHISNALVVHNFESKWHLKEAEWALITPTKKHRVVLADESVPDLYRY